MSEPVSSEFRPPEQLEFLTILGLVPPVSVDDVKQAYLEKAKAAHPDAGGDAEQFKRLQEAFEQATEYARFKVSRMQWLSHWVEQYAEQDQLISQVKALGGTVDVKSSDPMTRSIGPDFAVVLDKVTGIHLNGPTVNDAVLKQLGSQRRLLVGLHKLSLIDTSITDEGFLEVRNFENLRELDASGTPISSEALEVALAGLPKLETVTVERTAIGWAAKMKLKLTHRDVTIN